MDGVIKSFVVAFPECAIKADMDHAKGALHVDVVSPYGWVHGVDVFDGDADAAIERMRNTFNG